MHRGRTIYVAWGWFDSESTTRTVYDQFSTLHEQLRAGTSAADLEGHFGAAHTAATRLALDEIRRFEALAGEFCGAQPELGWTFFSRGSQRRGALAIQNDGVTMFSYDLEEVAARVARALGALLASLGATDTGAAHVD